MSLATVTHTARQSGSHRRTRHRKEHPLRKSPAVASLRLARASICSAPGIYPITGSRRPRVTGGFRTLRPNRCRDDFDLFYAAAPNLEIGR